MKYIHFLGFPRMILYFIVVSIFIVSGFQKIQAILTCNLRWSHHSVHLVSILYWVCISKTFIFWASFFKTSSPLVSIMTFSIPQNFNEKGQLWFVCNCMIQLACRDCSFVLQYSLLYIVYGLSGQFARHCLCSIICTEMFALNKQLHTKPFFFKFTLFNSLWVFFVLLAHLYNKTTCKALGCLSRCCSVQSCILYCSNLSPLRQEATDKLVCEGKSSPWRFSVWYLRPTEIRIKE